MIKVSIVIPVYNTSKYLVRCLESVKSQTLDGIEVIIVNDGSTDDSEKICEEYIRNNNLEWTISTKSNGGLSSARRHGWQLSTGEWIVFVDSDDELYPDYCKRMYETIVSTNSQLTLCGYNLCTETAKITYLPDVSTSTIENVPTEYGKRLILDTPDGKRLPGFLWMRMMKRELITEDCFINENKVYAEDQIFNLVYSKSVNRIAVISEALYNYYVNIGSLTLKYRPNMLEMNINLQQFYYNFLSSSNLLDDHTSYEFAKSSLEGVISSLINAARFGSLRNVSNIMKRIKTIKKYNDSVCFLKDKYSLTRHQRVWCYLIDNGISLIPYLYYKMSRKNQ